jgi:plasmid stabilization system protein ParE
MQLLVRSEAAADIEEAYQWYGRQRAGLGEEFLAAVDAKLQDITAHPAAYQIVHRDARRALLGRFPYAIYYRIYEEMIVVVACMHGRRDPTRWKARV